YNKSRTEKKKEPDKTLKGVLINNHVKTTGTNVSFDDIQNSLLICDSDDYRLTAEKEKDKKEAESSFDEKKALKPLLIGTGAILAGCLGLSAIFKASSKTLLNSKSCECLPDLAINNNIKQEPQFAIYRVIRDPSMKNIIAACAVFIMSAVTIAAKNFVDGAKEIWIKKKSADVEKELQENLIEVETNSFSGKLKVVNDMMNKNVDYFDKILNNKKEKENIPNIFGSFINFKGEEKNKKINLEQSSAGKNENNTNTEESVSKEKEEKIKNIKYALFTAGIAAAAILIGKVSISNIKQTAKNTNNLANNIASNTIDIINEKAKKPVEEDLPSIIRYFKSICAKPDYIKSVCKKYNLSEDKINSIINSVEEEKKTIFADAPTALGGIPKKLQYYCYIDENRGHLYNWIINPENKFTKYIFLSFTLSSAVGYLFQQGMDALKEYSVMKENAKTELDLRKRLVDVEIKNFKSKKESAITPLVDNFTKQANEGTKSKEELKELADNILTETKNGPPYVYT
ncbi:MAG: hypothetical protein LUH05_07100, partial [Candidatus Gastranaerophilales bacterium]|nr:hypothetical protein [Candidatus Gastranaerophilales bacterium]